MSHFFALIHNEKTFVRPQSKILSREAFSTIVNSQELLEKIKIDTDLYKKKAFDECSEVQAKAEQEGFQKGLSQWSEQIVYLEKSIKDANEAAEKLIVSIALEAAKKIVKREITLDPQTIVDIVKGSLKAVRSHKKVTVHVNPKEMPFLLEKKEQLESQFEKLESLSISPKEGIEAGGCVIETEQGIINAQWSKQWEALETAFHKLLMQNG